MKDGEIFYSGRWKHRMKSDNAFDGLYEQFRVLVETTLVPYFEKMINENVFRDLRAFAHWYTGYNKFSVEIFGFALPEDCVLNNETELSMGYEHFQENMFIFNNDALAQIINEMHKQNITGKMGTICGQFEIALPEFFYGFKVVWTCEPQNLNSEKARNARNN